MSRMDTDSFVLVLTNGTHVIDAANARVLNKAIDNRQAVVEVSIDLHGDGVRQTMVRIVTSHVVMIIAQDSTLDRDEELLGVLSGKIRRLRI